jgi:hypothetical protein
MKFEGRLEGRELATRAPRVDAGFVVLVRTAAGNFPARITNLSSTGFRMNSARAIEAGCEVTLEVPKRPPVKGLIRWASGKESGGVFLESVTL